MEIPFIGIPLIDRCNMRSDCYSVDQFNI